MFFVFLGGFGMIFSIDFFDHFFDRKFSNNSDYIDTSFY